MKKVFLHIDIDAFFASVTQIIFNKKENQPIAVSSLNSRTGIISSPNYAARSFGIKSAMPVFIAKNICPQLEILPHTRKEYDLYSQKVFDIITKFSKKITIVSIDECFVDVTDEIKKYHNNPTILAIKIQNEIKKNTNLKVSIGIAENKLIAKIATDLSKPYGILLINKDLNLKELLYDLDINEVPYIGFKTGVKLKENNINTIKDLVDDNNFDLCHQIIGSSYINFKHLLQAKKDIGLFKTSSNKSISRSTTLAFDCDDYDYLCSIFKNIIDDCVNELQRLNYYTSNVSINIKYADFRTKNKQQNINFYTANTDVIYKNVVYLFHKIYRDEKVRLIGVSLNKLIDKDLVDSQLRLID